jgi:hypothetical protein
MASSGWVAGLPATVPPYFAVEFRQRRGRGHIKGLGHWERAQASLE